jgi:hypothetical protein
MKKSLVTPTFLKQKAKALKKEKSISFHQALEETAIQYGFANYKHFLNDWETNQQPKSASDIAGLLKKLALEKDMAHKLDLAIPYVLVNKLSFPEMFDIFEHFREDDDAFQLICKSTFFLDHALKTMMLQYFQISKEDVQGLPLMDHFIAKDVVIEDITCELLTERLAVKGLYTIWFEFESMAEVPEDMKHMSHFNRDPMYGQFDLTIDRNKQFTIANPTIGEIGEDGKPYIFRFKLGQEHLAEIKRMREAQNNSGESCENPVVLPASEKPK